MPVTVAKRNGKWRVVEAETGRIARNRAGTPVDGGGHPTREKALAQARAINASLERRHDRKKEKRR